MAVRLGVLAYPGCFGSEVFGVADLIAIAAHVVAAQGATPVPVETTVFSARRHVALSGASTLNTLPLRPVDVLIVPGFEWAPATDIDAVLADLGPELETIRAHSAGGGAVVSICVGAFLLADAGVLDGRSATTSWLFADRLARRRPAILVRPDALVVTDGDVTTTGAFSAMYDYALGLIREQHGPDAARVTARIALVDDARCTQAPYVDTALLPAPELPFSERVMRHLDHDLAAPYDLQGLARAMHHSTRSLLRRFARETGHSPLRHLQAARVHRACRLLETTDDTVASIAARVGYADQSAFRVVFIRHTGLRPGDYRATFRRGRAPGPTGDASDTPPASAARLPSGRRNGDAAR